MVEDLLVAKVDSLVPLYASEALIFLLDIVISPYCESFQSIRHNKSAEGL